MHYTTKWSINGTLTNNGFAVPGQDNTDSRAHPGSSLVDDFSTWDISGEASKPLGYALKETPLQPGRILSVDADLFPSDILFWELSDSTGSNDHFIYSGSNSDKSKYSDVVYLNFDGVDTFTFSLTAQSTPEVPIPAAAWLLGSGLVGLVGLRRKRV